MIKEAILIFIVSLLLISCSENETDKSNSNDNFEETESTYSCSQYDARQAANKYLRMVDINPSSGYMDYYPDLSKPQNCYFVFYGAYSIGSDFDSSIESIYIYTQYADGEWEVEIEY